MTSSETNPFLRTNKKTEHRAHKISSTERQEAKTPEIKEAGRNECDYAFPLKAFSKLQGSN